LQIKVASDETIRQAFCCMARSRLANCSARNIGVWQSASKRRARAAALTLRIGGGTGTSRKTSLRRSSTHRRATISRIENGEIPYGQDFVEACADALGCEPGELIDRDPRSPPDILAQLCRRLPPSQRPVATEVLAAILRSNGAAIEPIVAPAKKGPSSSDFAPKTQRSRSIKGG
jgi:transcriptional regulator with XRE-family HTH domain